MGIELGVETVVDGMRLRGIIDRLDVTPDGDLIVVDYKNRSGPVGTLRAGQHGRGPDLRALVREPPRTCSGRGPLALPPPARRHFVSAVGAVDPRPAPKRAVAVWSAIERACDAEDFRPHVSPLCNHCHFKASCPAFTA